MVTPEECLAHVVSDAEIIAHAEEEVVDPTLLASYNAPGDRVEIRLPVNVKSRHAVALVERYWDRWQVHALQIGAEFWLIFTVKAEVPPAAVRTIVVEPVDALALVPVPDEDPYREPEDDEP